MPTSNLRLFEVLNINPRILSEQLRSKRVTGAYKSIRALAPP